jgi:hypothetical protein
VNSQIIFDTLVYRIGIVTFAIFNSVLIGFLLKRRARRITLTSRWCVILFMIVGLIGLVLNALSYLTPFSKQIADVFLAQAIFWMVIHYTVESL